MRGTPNTQKCIYKKLCIYSYKLKLKSPQSILYLMQYTYWDFSTAQNSFWTHWFWCLLVLLPFFVLPLPHLQNISLWTLFSSGETKKNHLGKIRWMGVWGMRVMPFFSQKLLNTQHGMHRCACKSPIVKWTNALKMFKKIIHWSWKQPITPMPAGILIQMGS